MGGWFPLLRTTQALANVHATFRELTQKKNRCAYFVYIPCVTVTLHCSFSDGFPLSQRRSRGLLLHRSHAMTHKFGRTLWPVAKSSPDKTQHSQGGGIHGSGGIRTRNPSKLGPQIHAGPYTRSRGGGGDMPGSARWGLTLNGNTAWRYPNDNIHFTTASPKKCVSLIIW